MKLKILTWRERCEIHPDHQSGMITGAMIESRMQEEISDLRKALESLETENARLYEIWLENTAIVNRARAILKGDA